jgi:hypothetical protein
VLPWTLANAAAEYSLLHAKQMHDQLARAGVPGTDWSVLWLAEMCPFRKARLFRASVTGRNLLDYWKRYGPPDEWDLHGDTLVCR